MKIYVLFATRHSEEDLYPEDGYPEAVSAVDDATLEISKGEGLNLLDEIIESIRNKEPDYNRLVWVPVELDFDTVMGRLFPVAEPIQGEVL